MKGISAVFVPLLLIGCSEGDRSICGAITEPSNVPAKTSNDQRLIAYSCVEKWAVRLSKAPDSAPVVAEAAMSACDGNLSILHEMARKDDVGIEPPTREHMIGHALFIVVQSRAGNCYSGI